MGVIASHGCLHWRYYFLFFRVQLFLLLLCTFSCVWDQADTGAKGAVSESSEAAVIPGPTGHIRGNSRQENKKVNFLLGVSGSVTSET